MTALTPRILMMYHSASGNTAWVTMHLADALRKGGVETTVHNIALTPEVPDFSSYHLIGFGCPVMGFRPAFAMTSFITSLAQHSPPPAFIFTTYAGVRANALFMLAEQLKTQGFTVADYEYFSAEVSWPIARALGVVIHRGMPNHRTLPRIDQFARRLVLLTHGLQRGNAPVPAVVPFSRLNLFYYFSLLVQPGRLRTLMGSTRIQQEKCTRCGRCAQYCPVGAIRLSPHPSFTTTCNGCWGCYNICPEGAIVTVVGTLGRYTAKAYLFNHSSSAPK